MPLALDYTYNQYLAVKEGPWVFRSRVGGRQVRLQTKAEDVRFLFGCQDDLSFLEQPTG